MRSLTALAGLLLLLTSSNHAQAPSHGPLFSPADLGILESPDRDEWQQPDRIMDALQIAEGSRVADVGAGGGWFTIRLARRVGPNGKVYAEDVQMQMIDSIRRRVDFEGLKNVEPILGTLDDPRLPPESERRADGGHLPAVARSGAGAAARESIARAERPARHRGLEQGRGRGPWPAAERAGRPREDPAGRRRRPASSFARTRNFFGTSTC